MFTQLFPIVQAAQGVILRLVPDQQDPSKMQVYISTEHPNGKAYPALNQTVMVCETPENLDKDFYEFISTFAPAYVSAATEINQVVAELKAAETQAKEAAAKKIASKSVPPGAKTPTKPSTTPVVSADKAPQAKTETLSLFAGLEAGQDAQPNSTSGHAPDGSNTPLIDEEDEHDDDDAPTGTSAESSLSFQIIS